MILSPVELRHVLHQNPELSFNEFETTKLLMNNLIPFVSEGIIKIHTPLPTGLLVEYKPNSGSFLLFRADIDALPIKEENDIAFKSNNNFMHACGHDVHTSILYGFLLEVLKKKIDKNILFLFQPAEETGGGAIKFFSTGIFDDYKIENAFALHVTDEYEKGTIASTAGVLFASSLEVDVQFIGENSHVAFPQNGKNAFNALRMFLDSVDKIPRNLNEPFIFGAGKVSAGEIRNISPGFAKIESTLRCLSNEIVERYFLHLELILEGIKLITGVDFKITKGTHYPEVIVNQYLFETVFSNLSNKFTFIDCGYKMTGEDFGFISKKIPSFMFWLGVSEGEMHGLHNSKFLPADDVIELGKDVFSELLSALKS